MNSRYSKFCVQDGLPIHEIEALHVHRTTQMLFRIVLDFCFAQETLSEEGNSKISCLNKTNWKKRNGQHL